MTTGKSYLLMQHCDRLSLHSNDLKRSEELRSALRNHIPDADILITAEAGEKILALSDGLYCKLQYKGQLFLEFSIENAEIMENFPWKNNGFY